MEPLKFNLHSIIMLIGPDSSGKSDFAKSVLMGKLKAAQCGKKELRIAYINDDQIFLELSGGKQSTEQAKDILFNRLKNFTTYPVNFDFVVVDTSGLDSDFRTEVLRIGEENHYNVSALIFNYDNKDEYYHIHQPSGFKQKADPVQMKALKRILSGEISKKDYHSIQYITSRASDCEIVVEDYSLYDQYILPADKQYVIIGDIHGCYDELLLLLKLNGFEIDENLKVTHPDNKAVLLVGDLIDKGLFIKEVVELAYANIGTFYMTIGNHEQFVYGVLSGALKKGSIPDQAVVEEYFNSIEIFRQDEELMLKFFKVFEAMKNFYVHKNFIVTHAPCEKKYLGKIGSKALKATRDFRYPKVKEFESFAEFMFEFDEWTKFVRDEASDFCPIHVFGHVMTKEMSRYKNKLNIDTGCVAGGALSSIIIDGQRVSVQSVKAGEKIEDKTKQLFNFFC